eukprot:CAMPEP_0174752396 /NCGR_PEP_ID=MMETSP1094-20130205/101938_1 /TAXON_ID=156173 /ORGANISM="Chrysochromulina brevifilum, Strain UTEX LB 985" /LENGTH=41 /DNA_ID= /DNA_START= /DNA_END= /DNA_ORIENTATION=
MVLPAFAKLGFVSATVSLSCCPAFCVDANACPVAGGGADGG